MSDRYKEVTEAFSGHDRFLLITHENPDGDAIGSLSATSRLLGSMGSDALMYLSEGDDPAPEYSFLVDWTKVTRTVPDDINDRVIVLLDCGNAERRSAKELGLDGHTVVNIDHHHDNTEFGTVNLVESTASCTAEIVWRIAGLMNLEIDRRCAQALYVGLVTDTGRFMYSSAGPHAHLMAADLIDRGVDVQEIFRQIYEGIAAERIDFLAIALGAIERFDNGALAVVWLTRKDFDSVGAPDGWSEGIIDYLRSIEGTKVAAVIREPAANPQLRRISLRSSVDSIDVSAIARNGGGGGHRLAAGFSSALDRTELIDFIRHGIADQISGGQAAA